MTPRESASRYESLFSPALGRRPKRKGSEYPLSAHKEPARLARDSRANLDVGRERANTLIASSENQAALNVSLQSIDRRKEIDSPAEDRILLRGLRRDVTDEYELVPLLLPGGRPWRRR